MKYLDTGYGQSNQTLGSWLKGAITPRTTGLWVQSGYFGYESLAVYGTLISSLARRGRPVRVVLGANQASLSADDLRRVLGLLEETTGGSLTVVAYSNALFHPKTYVVRDQGGQYRAYVGSANMTGPGVGMNVEAAIALSSEQGDDPSEIQRIVASIEGWTSRDEDGTFHIRKAGDIDDLVASSIISLSRPPAQRRRTTRTGVFSTSPERGIGRRTNLFPSAPLAPFALPDPMPSANQGGMSLEWSKVMPPSDAQQVSGATNPTGKLRLAKAGHDIDHKTWFREVFFDGVEWTTEMRGNRAYEVAMVPFDVNVGDVSLGVQHLKVDHAPHRVADQNNVPTVLAWGHEIETVLVGTSYVRHTVTLLRTEDGTFKLSID